jgi:hypothetical protein
LLLFFLTPISPPGNNYPDVPDNAITWAPIRQASRSFLSLPGPSGFITAIDVGR